MKWQSEEMKYISSCKCFQAKESADAVFKVGMLRAMKRLILIISPLNIFQIANFFRQKEGADADFKVGMLRATQAIKNCLRGVKLSPPPTSFDSNVIFAFLS